MQFLNINFSAETLTAAIENSYRLEICGRYEEALEIFKEIRTSDSLIFDVEIFEPATAAEILLRCGALLGFAGHQKQIPHSQENSKNLLTEARERFVLCGEMEKVAECENYLALAYWRTGELNEAETWINESLSHDLPDTNRVKLYSWLTRSVIQIANKRFAELLRDFGKIETNFTNNNDAFFAGCFCTNYGIALKNLGETSEALHQFKLAKFCHQKSEHKIYLGTVENNLAQIYKTEKKFEQAHQAINNAAKIFREIKDQSRQGFCLDTKAQIYFDGGQYAEALETVENAVEILRKGENLAYLIETLATKIKILLYLDDFAAAVFCLTEAVQTAKIQIGEDCAKNLIAEFERTLLEKNQRSANSFTPEKHSEKLNLEQTFDEEIELLLPPSLSHHKSIQVVLLNRNHLENLGLYSGNLAIVANEKVKRGDLTAISEKATDAVLCGFYDEYFGIVCMETLTGEPQFFDADAIEILGKIVGVTDTVKNENGAMVVETVSV